MHSGPLNEQSLSLSPWITVDNLNDLYVHDNGTVYRVVTYAAEPTVTLERIFPFTGEPVERSRLSGVVGSPIFAGLRRLVPEADGSLVERR